VCVCVCVCRELVSECQLGLQRTSTDYSGPYSHIVSYFTGHHADGAIGTTGPVIEYFIYGNADLDAVDSGVI